MPHTLDLAALRSFVAVAQTGSVTRAAASVHLTQSAVSMQMKRLEAALGLALFDRSRKAMVLTASGEQLLSYARRMLELNDEVWSRLTHHAFEGELTLGAPHDIVYPHVPEVLRRFAKRFPRVRVTLQSSYTHRLKAAFAAGEIDLILTTELVPETTSEVLETSSLVWIGAPGGTAWRQRPLPLAFERGCIFRGWVQRALDDAGVAWTMAVDSVSIRTVDASCSADFAVSAAIQSTVPPQLAVVEHGAALPPLPAIRTALYVTDGPRAELAQTLAGIIRDQWARTAPQPEAAMLAAE